MKPSEMCHKTATFLNLRHLDENQQTLHNPVQLPESPMKRDFPCWKTSGKRLVVRTLANGKLRYTDEIKQGAVYGNLRKKMPHQPLCAAWNATAIYPATSVRHGA